MKHRELLKSRASSEPALRAPAGLSRRRFLQMLGVGGLAATFADFLPAVARSSFAENAEPLYFIFCTFEGGWDQLLALDPRDNTQYQDAEGVIYPAYHLQAPNNATFSSLLSSNPSGLLKPTGSNITFGPSVGRLAEGNLYQDLCVIRGLDMGTLTHEVGRRYFLTGKVPRGLQASGSALSTWMAAQGGARTLIPNLVVGMETYNEGLDSAASGLVVQSYSDIQTVLTALGTPLAENVNGAIDAYLQPTGARCEYDLLNGNGQVTQYLSARTRAVNMVEGNLGSLFAFTTTPSTPELQALYEAFHIGGTNAQINAQLAGGAGEAMLAAQAITNDLVQCASIRLAENIDHHDDDYLTTHFASLNTGFNALADLIQYLKGKQHPTTGKSFWEHSVLLVTSDFARTPNLNNRSGRDHHLASSCLVAGKGIRGNQVIGGTDELNFGSRGIDLATGAPLESGGWTVRPSDVHASLLDAVGLPYDHIENQSPQIISALRKG